MSRLPGAAELTRNAKVVYLSAAWLLEVEASDLAKSTEARYAMIATQLASPGIGQLRLRELSMPAVARLLRVIKAKSGAAKAKGVRSVMSSMVGMAMRHGAMTTNPTRDVAPISVQTNNVRALTTYETELLVKKLRAEYGRQAARPGRPGRAHARHRRKDPRNVRAAVATG